MLGLRYALGLGRACDLQDNKCSVRPRAPVWHRLKTLRCLSKYGFSKVGLQINGQYAPSIMGLPRVLEEEVALTVGSVDWVLKKGNEGYHRLDLVHASDSHWLEMMSYRSVTRWMKGLNLGASVRSRPETDVELTCDETGGRFVFRALCAVRSSKG
ncbi:unnamed protein product [Prunus armeniaca]